jgi:hypothetical protein
MRHRKLSRSSRLRQERHTRGHCTSCDAPVARDPKSFRFPWQCSACRTKGRAAHDRANARWREQKRARGECVRCGGKVHHFNKHTGRLCSRCITCERHHSDAQYAAAHLVPEFAFKHGC